MLVVKFNDCLTDVQEKLISIKFNCQYLLNFYINICIPYDSNGNKEPLKATRTL